MAFIGNKQALNILKPLVGRNMSVICLNSVSLRGRGTVSSHHIQDGVIDTKKSKYLLQICAILSETFHSCLKYLDLSKNRWMDSTTGFVGLFTLRSLVCIIY